MTFNLILKYKYDPHNEICIVGQINYSVSFTNVGSPMINTNSTATEASVALVVKDSSGMNKLHILCYKCKIKGTMPMTVQTLIPAVNQ